MFLLPPGAEAGEGTGPLGGNVGGGEAKKYEMRGRERSHVENDDRYEGEDGDKDEDEDEEGV